MSSTADAKTDMIDKVAQAPADIELAIVLDRISEHIVIQDEEMRIIWANHAAGVSVGAAQEDLVGRRCYEVWQGRQDPCPGCPVRDSVATGVPAQAEISTPDGRHWFIKGYPLKDGAGGITGAVEITMDVTGRKIAEEALWESRQKYSNLFQYSSDAVFVHDLEGNIVDVNQKALDLTGYTRPEILSLKISDLHPAAALERSRQAFEEVSKSGFAGFEIDLRRKDGTVFQSEVSSSLLEIQGSKVIQGIVRDITERKMAEQALRRSEETHRSLVENINEIIFTLDTKGRFTYISPVLYQTLGYSPGDILGKPFNCFVHPDDAPGLLVTLERGLDGTQRIDEVRVLDKNGETRFVRISCRPNMDGDRLVGVAGIMADITESKMAKAILRESEEMYETLIRTTTDGVTVTDPQGRITEVSGRTLQLHGYERPEDLIGRSSFDLIAAEDHRRALQNLKATLKQGFLRRTEYGMVRRDGTQFIGELDAAVIKDAHGNPKGFITTTRDVTERKRAEQALRKSEQRFKDITENASEWIWEVDAQGTYTYSSPVVKSILGYELEEILGRHFFELYPLEDRERQREAVFEVFASKKPFRERRHRNVRKDGTTVWLSTCGVPILTEGGELLGYRGADTNITEGMLASEELEAERDHLARTLKAIHEGVVATDLDGRIVLFNESAENVTGVREQEALGRPLTEVLPVQLEEPESDGMLAKVLRSPDDVRFSGTAAFTRGDGDRIRLGYTAAKIRDKDGKAAGIVVVFSKIEDSLKGARLKPESDVRGAHLAEEGAPPP
jgi:PAS domain S-box-containing protein